MPNDTRHLDLVIGAKDEATPTLEKTRALLKKVQDEARGAGGLAGLKEGFGRSSSFTQALKIFQGGGAVLGLGLAGRELNAFADKSVALAGELRDGAKSGGQIAEELAKSIPVFGQLFDAGRKFRSLLDGTAEDAARLKDALDVGKSIEATAKLVEKDRERRKAAADELQRTRDAAAKVGREGVGLSLLDVDQREAEQRRKADDARAALLRGTGADTDPNLKALQDKAEQQLRRVRRLKDELHEESYTSTPKQIEESIRQEEASLAQTREAITSAVRQREDARRAGLADIDKQRAADARKNERDREEAREAAFAKEGRQTAEHEARMTQFVGEANASRLRLQGKALLASLAQLRAEYLAQEQAAEEARRAATLEAERASPDQSAGGLAAAARRVAARFSQEAAGRGDVYEQKVAEAVAADLREKVGAGYARFLAGFKENVSLGSGSVFAAAGRRLLRGANVNFNPDAPQQTAPFPLYAPNIDAGVSTGVGVAAAFGYGGRGPQSGPEAMTAAASKLAEAVTAFNQLKDLIRDVMAQQARLLAGIDVTADQVDAEAL